MYSAPTVTRPIVLLGTGHALPGHTVSSATLDTQLKHPVGTIERLSGVRQRHFACEYDTAAALGAQAAHRALDAACVSLADIDCLVAASGTMDQGMPSNAALIHRELGLSAYGIPAFDINASCLSFLVALDTLSWPLMAGRYRNVLIVAADLASCGLNWHTLESSAIFGDGAAAAVITQTPEGKSSRLLAANFKTLSDGADLCYLPAGGSRYHPSRTTEPFMDLTTFRMNGKGIFKLTAQHLPDFVDHTLSQAGIGRQELDWIVPHQGSLLAITHMSRRLGFPSEKVINIFPEHGNQVAASLPTALDIAIRDGRIQRGQRVLLLGTGAGLSLGATVLEY